MMSGTTNHPRRAATAPTFILRAPIEYHIVLICISIRISISFLIFVFIFPFFISQSRIVRDLSPTGFLSRLRALYRY